MMVNDEGVTHGISGIWLRFWHGIKMLHHSFLIVVTWNTKRICMPLQKSCPIKTNVSNSRLKMMCLYCTSKQWLIVGLLDKYTCRNTFQKVDGNLIMLVLKCNQFIFVNYLNNGRVIRNKGAICIMWCIIILHYLRYLCTHGENNEQYILSKYKYGFTWHPGSTKREIYGSQFLLSWSKTGLLHYYCLAELL